jgi:CIC family chloride channel protein
MQKLLARKLAQLVHISETNLLILLSVLVGGATAFGAIGFIVLIEYFNSLFFGMSDQILTTAVGFANWGGYKLWLPLIPMLGGLLVAPIVFKFASEARGHGVPEVMNAVARLGGIIRPRVAAAKTLASAICIGSGGSAGREGPIVQIGSALGSTIGQMFRMSGDRVKVLVGCGAAAGISVIFNAPIAGVIFSLEIILGDFAIKTFSPVILSSVVASVISRAFLGNHPAFAVPSYSLVSAWEIPLYVAMGIAIGALAVMFTKTLDWTEDLFENLKISNMIKPAIGGLLLGSLAIFYPQVLADGYQTISLTLYGDVTIWLMVILIFAKMLATCLTLGSGNSGGIFAPSLFMGAVAGGAFGVLVNYLFPGAVATPGAFALVGMAAMVAGTTHAPITAMLIIYEMTWDYRIILPLMVAVVFSALVAGRLFPHSIYTAKLFKRGIDIRGGKDVNVLRSYKVTDVMDDRFEAIPASMTLLDIFHVIEHSRDSYFIVKNARGEFKGVISFQDIRNLITQHELDYLVIAQDLVVSGAIVLNASDDLEHAQKLFGQRDFELMPVVRKLDPLKVVGVVRREALTDFYNKRLLETLRK